MQNAALGVGMIAILAAIGNSFIIFSIKTFGSTTNILISIAMLAFLILSSTHPASGTSQARPPIDSKNVTAILNTLVDGYDKRLRPNYGGAPVEVGITIFISTISAVSEVEMDFTIDMYLRQYWVDPRLRFNGTEESLSVGIEMIKNIWVPDTFFPNEKRSFFHDATTHNSFLRISPSGEVLRSLRLTVTGMCPMDLIYFPLDSQNCSLEIESYGYGTRDIFYYWREGNRSVSVSDEIHLAQFTIGERFIQERLITLSTGNYSRLSAYFTFHRQIGFYLIQIYLPSSLIVIISWVSFWLNREATQARVAIGVTTVLTMTTLMTSTNAAMPKVSYVKSIDLYLGTCFIIVFASLLEYAAVGYMMKRMRMKKERRDNRGAYFTPLTHQRGTYVNNNVQPPLSSPDSTTIIPPSRAFESPTTIVSHHPHQYQESLPLNSVGVAVPDSNRRGSQSSRYLGWSPTAVVLPPRDSFSVIPTQNPPECDCDIEQGTFPGLRPIRLQPKYQRRTFRPSSIDKYSRIFFPVTFISFHLIYWTVYLDAAELL